MKRLGGFFRWCPLHWTCFGLEHRPMSHSPFDRLFSIPREPETLLAPGQFFELVVPAENKIVITDIYVRNLGGGASIFRILEQRLPASFEVRYRFDTTDGQSTIINFTTGLKLGDEAPIAGTIHIENAVDSGANILPRINGYFVS